VAGIGSHVLGRFAGIGAAATIAVAILRRAAQLPDAGMKPGRAVGAPRPGRYQSRDRVVT
jgi:hypothetical protein